MDYTLLKEIIRFTEEFQKERASSRIEDFAIWLNSRLFSGKDDNGHSGHDELLIAFKLLHLNKSLKKQAKSVLLESRVSSIDEYSFLLHLKHHASFRKMEIIELHNLEAPTGIEVIKRLIKNKLIEEFPDEQDKRAKRIRITNEGSNELGAIAPRMDKVFHGVTESLDLNEKVYFSGVLDKLIH